MIDFEALRGKEDWVTAADGCCSSDAALAHLLGALGGSSSSAAPNADDQRRQQRAGFILLHVHKRCPGRLHEHAAMLLALLPNLGPAGSSYQRAFAKTHPSLARQVFSVLQDQRFGEELASRVFAKAVDYFLVTQLPIAVRARALDCAANVARQYVGLWPEVQVLAQALPLQSAPGLLSLRRRLLAEAAKLST